MPPATRTVNPDARFKVFTAWNAACGLPATVTDVNGQVTTKQYDALCRPIREDRPGGDVTETSYVNFAAPSPTGVLGLTTVSPTPGNQYVETRRRAPSDDPAARIWSRDYIDGLGRSYRTISQGPDVTQVIDSTVAFNARGYVSSTSAPHYALSTQFEGATLFPLLLTTNYSYDKLDRLTAIAYPGGGTVSLAYNLSNATSANIMNVQVTDEVGHTATYALDGRGKVVARLVPVQEHTEPKTDEERMRQLVGRLGSADIMAYVAEARRKANVAVNPKAFE